MKQRIACIALVAAAACSSPSTSQTGSALVPVGVRVAASGFATIEQAPPSPFPAQLPPAENRPKDERGFYARMAGVSDEEAAERIAEQHALRPQFERLLATLRKREPGNFTDARVVHKPDWAFVLYFKRDPQRTLAKYTKHPHFRAAQARFSTAELRALAKPWVERFMAARILGGHGTDATFGEVMMHVLLSEEEYRVIAQREGWGPVPDAIKLEFAESAIGPAVAPELKPLVRIFAQGDRALGATNEALLSGRIVLRGGCFYVASPDQQDRLAYFGREVALGVDDQGYLALRTRSAEPRHLGRIGEMFSWGGPIGIGEDAPMVAELRARCGNAPLEHVGVPDSSRLFSIRPYVIDAIAERRKISRDEAWRRFRECMEQREASRPGPVLDCDML